MIFIYILLFCLILSPFILLRFVYFRPVSCLCLKDGKFSVEFIKPSKRVLRGLFSGSAYLGNGYYAYCCPSDFPSDNIFSFNSIQLSSTVYIFRCKRLRFSNLDLSDRFINDIIKKINY